jgi:hypothetical protein
MSKITKVVELMDNLQRLVGNKRQNPASSNSSHGKFIGFDLDWANHSEQVMKLLFEMAALTNQHHHFLGPYISNVVLICEFCIPPPEVLEILFNGFSPSNSVHSVYLRISRDLSSVEFWNSFAKSIASNSTLHKISLSGSIKSVGVVAASLAGTSIRYLHLLSLERCFADLGAYMLRNCPTLNILKVSCYKSMEDPAAMKNFLNALRNNNSLETLYMDLSGSEGA